MYSTTSSLQSGTYIAAPPVPSSQGASSPSPASSSSAVPASSSPPHQYPQASQARGNFNHVHGLATASGAAGTSSIATGASVPPIGQLMLAKYFLQCDAIGEPIDDPQDIRRLLSLTVSMAEQEADQVLGCGNRPEDNRRTNKESLYRSIAGKKIIESRNYPSLQENPEAHAREKISTSGSAASVLKASYCGGRAAYLTYAHSNKLGPGEAVAYTALATEAHEYVEVKPAQEEVESAALAGQVKHPAVGDTWLEGRAAMLKPHTRHAASRSISYFSISQENARREIEYFLHTRAQVAEVFLPIVGEVLQDLRNQNIDLPEPHPLAGKSVADPAFVQSASEALHRMDSNTRRDKAGNALHKAAIAPEHYEGLVDQLIAEAMTVHDSERE